MASRKSLLINSLIRKENAKGIKGVRYLGFDNNNTFMFSMRSASRDFLIHRIYIQLEDLTESINDFIVDGDYENLNVIKTAINLALTKRVRILCTCEDFLYSGAKYWNTRNGSGIEDEDRAPQPNKKRTLLCKHILYILANISRYLGVMAKSVSLYLRS